MKIESRVVAVSWIPSEAIKGAMKAPFELGIAHYDEPLPDVLGDPRRLAGARPLPLRRTTCGRGSRSTTTVPSPATGTRAGARSARRPWGDGGGIGDVPGRRLSRPAGRARGRRRLGALPPDRRRPHRGAGAAPRRQAAVRAVPRAHRLVDALAHDPHRRHGRVGPRRAPARSRGTGSTDPTAHWPRSPAWSTSRTGTVTPFGDYSPWGGEDSPALVTAVESALERELSRVIMGEGKPKIRKLKEGATLTEQGEEADAIYLLLDGVLQVRRRRRARSPSWARARSSASGRCSRAVAGRPRSPRSRRCKVAEARKVELDMAKLAEISEGHRREDQAIRMRVHVLGVRGSTPAPGHEPSPATAATPRASRWLATASSRRLVLDAGTGIRAADGAARRERPSGARSCSATCTGTTPRACRSPEPSTTTAPRCACACPIQEDGDSRGRRPAPGACPRRTSRSAPRGCGGAWTLRRARARRPPHRRLRGARPRDPAQGRAHLRLPRQRRAARPSPTCPTTGPRRSAPAPTVWGRTTTRAWPWPRTSTS